MTISRANAAGWTDDADNITAAQINTIDTNTTYAVDGAGGGTYNPSSAIIFGGSGIQLSGTSNIALASRSITRFLPLHGITDQTSNFYLRAAASPETYVWKNSTAAIGVILIEMDLPHGQSLSEVHVRVDPAGGHGGDVTAPSTSVESIDADNTIAVLKTGTDTTGGVLASGYESAHWISASTIGHTVDRTQYRYQVRITGETGGNWIVGATYTALKVVCDCTGYTEF